ncbi:hypothetical protein [Wolbachia endosymbiont of Folsomia candida]|uniref:hypothetical protein n=1 Tax=Wolbachia endosymbiont of Folsomia candida TaxID=169402 RepID=UPI000AEF93D2|nr:hypothetical protein [Wolbachia endosymbiont of Folsomia candida]APR99108.1 hypothetical protein ASM33_07980 [Wolbachia endosymbiont of Folsomia candida]
MGKEFESEKNHSKDSDNNKGTTLSGNTLRVASTALAFMLLGPVGGMAVGALALADHGSKGKFSEAGKDLASGTGNILESLWKGIKSLVEQLLPHEKKQEVSLNGSGTNRKGHGSAEINNHNTLSTQEVKAQAKKIGEELKKALTGDQAGQNRVNDISEQQGMER